jgi:mannose-6-phosphate isomerase
MGDVIFVPAGTVHAIGSGVLLYELQEYSDVTYRMYDYGRLTTSGKPRELHIERSLDVSDYEAARQVKVTPVLLEKHAAYSESCLVACQYFVTSLLQFERPTALEERTDDSCVILTSLGAEISVEYGDDRQQCESLARGQTLVLPAALGDYRITTIGAGQLLRSYVPATDDAVWQAWRSVNAS